MVEAGQAQVPVGGGEGGRAPEHLLDHEELGTVKDDSGDVTEEEDHDDADEDSGQVHLIISILVCFHVAESDMIIIIIYKTSHNYVSSLGKVSLYSSK